MAQLVLNTLSRTLGNFFNAVALFLPRILSMLVIIAAGFLVALILKVIVRRIFGIASFRKYCDSAGLTQMMRKAALPDPVEFLGQVVFWVILIVFIVLGVDVLGISALREQISRFFLFLPQIFVAMVVLFIGLLIANFFSRATLLATTNANYPSARLLSSLVRCPHHRFLCHHGAGADRPGAPRGPHRLFHRLRRHDDGHGHRLWTGRPRRRQAVSGKTVRAERGNR